MTSGSSISTLEIRKEGTSRFCLCIEWTSTFNCFYYMVLTLMELGSHSSCNDHKHHSSAMNHGWPWSGYCPDVVVTSNVLRLKCLSFTSIFIDFFYCCRQHFKLCKFKFTSASLIFSIITDLRPSISLITSKLQNLKTTLRVLISRISY